MPIYLAAANSPKPDKARADVQCQDLARDQILKAADEAAKQADALIFAPGFYRLENGLQVECELRGVGYANFAWVGAPGEWMVQSSRAMSGLYLYCDHKARAIKVDNAHHVTFENLHIFDQANEGLRIEKGWNVTVRNVRSMGGTGTAFRFNEFHSSKAERLYADRISSTVDGVLWCEGTASSLETVNIEDCDGPAVRLKEFDYSSLNGLFTERIGGHAIVRIEKTIGARLSRFSHWQRPEGPIDVGVDVIGCERVEVDGVYASNIRDAILQIDADSYQGGCTWRNIVDRYGKLRPDSGGYKSVVQPRHIVDVRGYDHEPVKEPAERTE